MSDEPEQEYFSDGISEDIITALSKLRWFFVIARNSSFIYKGKAVHLKQIAEELGVGYVVEGSVRKSGDRVRITAQLNDVATGSHIWAERYDREPCRRVRGSGRDHRGHRRRDRAAALRRGKFSRPAQAAGQHGRLGSGDAGAVALLASDAAGQSSSRRRCWRRRSPSTRTTARRLASLPSATPSAPIWVGRTWQPRSDRRTRGTGGDSGRQRGPLGAHALGSVYLFKRRFDDSLAEFELALRLNPNFSLAQGYYGLALSYAGGGGRPILAARRALRLSPRDPFSALYYGIAAYAEFVGRNYDEAMRSRPRSDPPTRRFRRCLPLLTAAAAWPAD